MRVESWTYRHGGLKRERVIDETEGFLAGRGRAVDDKGEEALPVGSRRAMLWRDDNQAASGCLV